MRIFIIRLIFILMREKKEILVVKLVQILIRELEYILDLGL